MGARVRMSEKEAIERGLIADPRLTPKIPPPEPYRVPDDHDWSTGSPPTDQYWVDTRLVDEGDDDSRALFEAMIILGSWLVGILTGWYIWGGG